MRSPSTSLVLGCTYWPRRLGPWFWSQPFDRGEVRDELQHIADLGCGVVRVCLPWEQFQPQAALINRSAFQGFEHFLALAETAGLPVVATLFVGAWYGSRFVPRWLLHTRGGTGPQSTLHPPPQQRTISEGWEAPLPLQNFYEQSALLGAQRYFIQELVGYFGSHPLIGGWDLGGGGLIAGIPPRGAEAALHWLDHLVQVAREADPHHPVWYAGQLGLLRTPGLPRLAALRPLVDAIGLRVIPYGHPMAQGPADVQFVLYSLLLAGTLADTGGQPLGGCDIALPTAAPGMASERVESPSDDPDEPPQVDLFPAEEMQAEFFAALIPALQAHGVPVLWHAAYADVPPALFRVPPFDQVVPLRRFGLVRADGSEKPGAQQWRQLASQLARGQFGAFGRAARALDIDNDEFARDPMNNFGASYRRYREGEI